MDQNLRDPFSKSEPHPNEKHTPGRCGALLHPRCCAGGGAPAAGRWWQGATAAAVGCISSATPVASRWTGDFGDFDLGISAEVLVASWGAWEVWAAGFELGHHFLHLLVNARWGAGVLMRAQET